MAEERKKQDQITSPAHIAAAKSAASQRRHKLESNTLVDQLNRFVQTIKEGPNRTAWIIGGVIIAIVLLYAVWQYFARSSDEKSSSRWLVAMRIFDGETVTPVADEKAIPLGTEGELEKFVKDNQGTSQARIARFYLARIALAQGESGLGSQQRDIALERVQKAAKLYEELKGESSDTPILHQEALLRSGKAREMLGEFSKALDNYNQLIKDYPPIKDRPKSDFVVEAEAGRDRLKDGSVSRKELDELFKKSGS